MRQAGSYVGPDKLRFDFTHGKALTPEELHDIEEQANRWILEAQPVRAITTTLEEARRLGAMALFGEKYGDVVRMVEVGDGSFSRELCGGTHVRNTAEIGLFKLLSESSSAANMRRIEALTGPAAVELMRRHDRELADAAKDAPGPARARRRRGGRASRARARARARRRAGRHRGSRRRGPAGRGGASSATAPGCWSGRCRRSTARRCSRWPTVSRTSSATRRSCSAATGENRVDLVASVAPALVERGVRAGEIVKLAAAEVGGGGGGRDTLARAGGRDPAGLPRAFEAARAAIESALGG